MRRGNVMSLGAVLFWWAAGAIGLGVALKVLYLLVNFGWGLL